jgi:hypothetical protein
VAPDHFQRRGKIMEDEKDKTASSNIDLIVAEFL